VPSPKPLEVVEVEAIRALLAAGTIAVACGGGGIPVASRDGRLNGVDAVIDKDRASALLAAALEAERLLILTDVDAVVRGWGTPDQEELRELSAAAAEALLPALAAGSIGPKVEASLTFARSTGNEALITSATSLAAALAGDAGTRIRA
jgi:carbamate kinase